MDRHWTKIAAVGRHFQLGDLYDYRNDHTVRFVTDEKPWWELTNLPTSTEGEAEFQLQLFRPDSETTNKWEHMELDDHLQASSLAGLIDPSMLKGASHYLNDRSNPSQVSVTLICRATSRKEQLDLHTLFNPNVLHLPDNQETIPKATHVVTGITYGAEAYCVLAQDLNVNDPNSKEEAQEVLSRISAKMSNALGDHQDVAEFKDLFNKEEKKLANQLKCRLYADFQTQNVRECGVFDAYKQCLKTIEGVKKQEMDRVVQISVTIFPLKVIFGSTGTKLFEYRDVSSELVSRCCRIWTELERVTAQADAMRSAFKFTRTSLRQFVEVLGKYQELFKKKLMDVVVRARQGDNDSEVEKAVTIAETHPLFKISRLHRWLRFKKAESELAAKMASLKSIVFLTDKSQLQKELDDTLSFDRKFALVLNIPSLGERTEKLTNAMKEYVETYTRLIAVENDGEESDEEDETKLPWNLLPRQRKLVMDKIHELVDHIEKNKRLENRVQFFIMPSESGKNFECSYSVFQVGLLLKDNLGQLPSPPTGLRVQNVPAKGAKRPKLSTVAVLVKWNYEDLGYPYTFLVEYRPKDDPEASWKEQKTSKGETQMTIHLNKDSVFDIRVAADTCIGRSEFSEIVDTETATEECVDVEKENSVAEADTSCLSRKSARLKAKVAEAKAVAGQATVKQEKQEPSTSTPVPKKKPIQVVLPPTKLELDFVTQTTAEIRWTPSRSTGSFSYSIRYWKDVPNLPSSIIHELNVGSKLSSYPLEDLQPGTKYKLNIVTTPEHGQESAPSDVIEFTTERQEVRFADLILKKCKKIGNRNGMDMYAVPLVKSARAHTADRFSFGKAKKQNGRMQHRTILVMGATGAGKTTLINGMINYIFNVEWQDNFRFQLIQEQQVGRSQVDSQTSKITAYDIHHTEGFRIPYSLTIVDTPGYGDTKGLDRDQEITEMVRKFFEDKDGIQQLDVVGFVAQASLPRLTPTQIYIFDSVLSIFGNDIKDNINFLLTFADSQIPPVLSAIGEAGLPCPLDAETGYPLHHKFNNSGFFCSSRESGAGSGPTNTVDRFNRFFWKMGMDNFQRFFNGLATMETKSLSLTKQVLEERKQLEATVDGLQPLIKTGLAKMEEMRKINQMINNCQTQIEANENVVFEVEVTRPKKVEIPAGQYLTNCNKCHVTCHFPCNILKDSDKAKCSAMDHSMPKKHRGCRVCPEKCVWNMHANQPYRWEYVTEKQATSSNAIKAKYETELKKKLTSQQLVRVLKDDVEKNERAVLDRVETVSRCIKRLDQIALRPNPFSTPQYIDLIIDAEQQEKRLGFQERIESLKSLRQMAVITSKIKNRESLLKLENDDDFALLAIDDGGQSARL